MSFFLASIRAYLIHHFNVFVSFKFLFFINTRIIWKCSIWCIYQVLVSDLVFLLIFQSVNFYFNRSFFFCSIRILIIRVSLGIYHSCRTYIDRVFRILIVVIVLSRIIFFFPFLGLLINYWIQIARIIFSNLNFLGIRIKCISLLIIVDLFIYYHSLFRSIIFLFLIVCLINVLLIIHAFF